MSGNRKRLQTHLTLSKDCLRALDKARRQPGLSRSSFVEALIRLAVSGAVSVQGVIAEKTEE